MLWRRAWRDRLDVLGAERAAVDTMGRLLEWAETVVLVDAGSGPVEEQDVNGGRDGKAEDVEVLTLAKAAQAGKNLCSWLGDVEGALEIEAFEMDEF